jgi:hypothetical protein
VVCNKTREMWNGKSKKRKHEPKPKQNQRKQNLVLVPLFPLQSHVNQSSPVICKPSYLIGNPFTVQWDTTNVQTHQGCLALELLIPQRFQPKLSGFIFDIVELFQSSSNLADLVLDSLCKWNKTEHLSLEETWRRVKSAATTGSSRVWHEKYAAHEPPDLLGRETLYYDIEEWLSEFTFKQSRAASTSKVSHDYDDSDSDFLSSDFHSDIEEPLRLQKKALLLYGSDGTGKNMIIEMLGRRNGFSIKEINSSTLRTKKILEEQIGEVLRSHRIQSNDKLTKSSSRTLLVFDEVDTVFDEESSFQSFLNVILKCPQQPVVLMCNGLCYSFMTLVVDPYFSADPQGTNFTPKFVKSCRMPEPLTNCVVSLLMMVCAAEQGPFFISPSEMDFIVGCGCFNLRKIMLSLQVFMEQSSFVEAVREGKELSFCSIPYLFFAFLCGLDETDFLFIHRNMTLHTVISKAQWFETLLEKVEWNWVVLDSLSSPELFEFKSELDLCCSLSKNEELCSRTSRMLSFGLGMHDLSWDPSRLLF